MIPCAWRMDPIPPSDMIHMITIAACAIGASVVAKMTEDWNLYPEPATLGIRLRRVFAPSRDRF